jgi:hypothetical protein
MTQSRTNTPEKRYRKIRALLTGGNPRDRTKNNLTVDAVAEENENHGPKGLSCRLAYDLAVQQGNQRRRSQTALPNAPNAGPSVRIASVVVVFLLPIHGLIVGDLDLRKVALASRP